LLIRCDEIVSFFWFWCVFKKEEGSCAKCLDEIQNFVSWEKVTSVDYLEAIELFVVYLGCHVWFINNVIWLALTWGSKIIDPIGLLHVLRLNFKTLWFISFYFHIKLELVIVKFKTNIIYRSCRHNLLENILIISLCMTKMLSQYSLFQHVIIIC